jgi:hypothetical protein
MSQQGYETIARKALHPRFWKRPGPHPPGPDYGHVEQMTWNQGWLALAVAYHDDPEEWAGHVLTRYDSERRYHCWDEQGAGRPYYGFFAEAHSSIADTAYRVGHTDVHAEAVGWWRREVALEALGDVGNDVSHLVGCRLGATDDARRDLNRTALRGAATLHSGTPPDLADDMCVAMVAECRRRGSLRPIIPDAIDCPSLMSAMIVEFRELGRVLTIPRLEPCYGGPIWQVMLHDDGRVEQVGWPEALVHVGRARTVEEAKKMWDPYAKAGVKVKGQKLRDAPYLLDGSVLGELHERIVLGSLSGEWPPVKPPAPPAPPVKPPKPPRRPKPPSEPAEQEWIAGDHGFERLEGGSPRQCRHCYRGEKQHGSLPERVPRRVPGDMGKRPPKGGRP